MPIRRYLLPAIVIVCPIIAWQVTFAQAQTMSEQSDVRARAVAAGQRQVHVGLRGPLRNSALYQEPRPMLLVTAGYFPRNNIELAVGGTLGLPDAATTELFARAALYATLPIVRLFVAVDAGYYGTLFSGGDVSASDRGARLALDIGLQFNIPRKPGTRIFVTPMVYLTQAVSISSREVPFESGPEISGQTFLNLAAAISF